MNWFSSFMRLVFQRNWKTMPINSLPFCRSGATSTCSGTSQSTAMLVISESHPTNCGSLTCSCTTGNVAPALRTRRSKVDLHTIDIGYMFHGGTREDWLYIYVIWPYIQFYCGEGPWVSFRGVETLEIGEKGSKDKMNLIHGNEWVARLLLDYFRPKWTSYRWNHPSLATQSIAFARSTDHISDIWPYIR